MENELKTHLGSASFSLYHTPVDEKFAVNLLPPAICSSQKSKCSDHMKRTPTAEDEIGVFRAERYYGMKLEGEDAVVNENCCSNQGKKKEHRADLQYRREKSRSGTPSVSSESSWNSQAALFPSFLRNSSQNKTKGRNLLANLSCYRSCSDKKSIIVHGNLLEQKGLQGSDVRKEAVRNKQIPVILDGRIKRQTTTLEKQKPKFSTSCGSTREEQLAFPLSSSQMQNFPNVKDEDPRISLDVFGSKKLDMKELVAMNLERKLSVLTWDAIPKAKPIIQSTSRINQMNEDIGSDASSDLFEIENISGSNGQPSIRQASDGISSTMTVNTCYEPSEASIEWSALTASAADVPSVSDYNENKLTANNQISRLSMVGINKATVDKDVQKTNSGGLLGCKSHKAVSIAEAAYRSCEKSTTDPRHHPRLDSTKAATTATG